MSTRKHFLCLASSFCRRLRLRPQYLIEELTLPVAAAAALAAVQPTELCTLTLSSSSARLPVFAPYSWHQTKYDALQRECRYVGNVYKQEMNYSYRSVFRRTTTTATTLVTSVFGTIYYSQIKIHFMWCVCFWHGVVCPRFLLFQKIIHWRRCLSKTQPASHTHTLTRT